MGIRTIAFVFDYLIIAAYLIFTVVIGGAVNILFPEVFANPFSGQIASFFIVTLPISLYFILCESSTWQATWGKRKKGLQVVRADDTQLTILRAGSRTLLKFTPWELAHICIWQVSFAGQEPSPIITMGFILVWILIGANIISLWINPKHQTLYDWLTGTYVVRPVSYTQLTLPTTVIV